MAEPYRIVVGLEVHVQLLTQTKLFCGCRNKFGLPPNSATCPVCLGMPGVLPVMNRRAFELSLRAAMALNCQIAQFTKWDRKNYFYPDLPKNFQTSQFDLPFSRKGFLEISTESGLKKIRIHRIHLEEDAGKLIHDESGKGGGSLIDLNRTGTPLLEIVSEPDINAPEEAKAYLEEIRLIMRDLEVSDCEMQEGSLRCDANVNLHIPQKDGGHVATPIVEVKNLNSFRAVERAIRYEAERQYEEFQQTGKKLGEVDKATAGWNEARGITIVQRRKEEASDYRYFPEPDLVPVVVDEAWLARIREEVGELPAETKKRLQEEHGLSEYDVGVITQQGRPFTRYFETVVQLCGNAKEACNWMTNEILSTLNDQKIPLAGFSLTAEKVAGLINKVKETGLNKQRARDVYQRMVEMGDPADKAIKDLGFEAVSDESQLREIVQRAIASNAKAATDYKNGKKKAANTIKGAIMRETRGMANVEVVEKLLAEELDK